MTAPPPSWGSTWVNFNRVKYTLFGSSCTLSNILNFFLPINHYSSSSSFSCSSSLTISTFPIQANRNHQWPIRLKIPKPSTPILWILRDLLPLFYPSKSTNYNINVEVISVNSFMPAHGHYDHNSVVSPTWCVSTPTISPLLWRGLHYFWIFCSDYLPSRRN